MKNIKNKNILNKNYNNNNDINNLNLENLKLQLFKEYNKKKPIKENLYELSNKNKKYKNYKNKEININTNIKLNNKNYMKTKNNIPFNVSSTSNINNNFYKDCSAPYYNQKKNENYEKRECFTKYENSENQEINDLENEVIDFKNVLIYRHIDNDSFHLNKNHYNEYENNEFNDNLENSLEDTFFDIHTQNEIEKNHVNLNSNIDKNNNTTYKNFKNDENNEKQLLLDHIKRLEYQNNIFLNNLLNMYYVCVDYMKMQDEKIKKKDEIILFQNKIINNLRKREKLDDTNIYNNLDCNYK
ncbi:conserved Plasmodium protein, unknown function [Plasmodium gallinaceum]|uniref:Uncharacterized protein n=1 Tax=Plasmodium gallinaceum TaxID=5849 RepID=A0A1J1GN54_PLAGA|nr:conserved Plasmodium protein, unknown function [Plasmodium gallinaceum]CRG93897.1 conserved Plasmodium protein, unknown function [Plasmodium gallinaceum]